MGSAYVGNILLEINCEDKSNENHGDNGSDNGKLLVKRFSLALSEEGFGTSGDCSGKYGEKMKISYCILRSCVIQ